MRLLSRNNNDLTFTQVENPCEAYAILSHTWGQDEVSYQDICDKRLGKAGYRKIEFTIERAVQDGYRHVWVDTCCIDKTDRVELGEAINLMWSWYAKAAVCYVFLSDVSTVAHILGSRWFTRGWTLQELVAPSKVFFFSQDGVLLGDKDSLRSEILAACGIDTKLPVEKVPLAERFKWSLDRQTSRAEDLSYCLLGLLEVTLVFNYGESAQVARDRLLEVVAKEHGQRLVREIQHMLLTHVPATSVSADLEPTISLDFLLKTLDFEAASRRWQTISNPYKNTCTWILKHEDYMRWSDRTANMLWIKGKAGSGKSTLVKFLQSRSTQCTFSFYFHARGELLEHSMLGMYRSILSQILRKQTEIAYKIVGDLQHEARNGIRWDVTVTRLQAVLRSAIALLQEPVKCFIDALDECDQREVQSMVDFLEDQASPNFQVCFASRHYPTITIRRSIELALEQQQHSDIAIFVRGRLNVGEDPLNLAEKVIDKANGVFIWVVLVIGLLNDDLSSGNIYQVDQRLQSLPQGMSELLEEIVLQGADEDVHRFRLSIYWLLYRYGNMTPGVFYLAMTTGLCDAGLAPESAYTTASKDIPDEYLKRFVINCSRGLAEVTESNTVELVHETVRQFLSSHDGRWKLRAGLDLQSESRASDVMKCICLRYATSMQASAAVINRPKQPQSQSQRLFMLYTQDYLLRHAEKAAHSIDQKEFLRQYRRLASKGKDSVSSMLPPDLQSVSWSFSSDFKLLDYLVHSRFDRLIRTCHELGISMQCDTSFTNVNLARSGRHALLEPGRHSLLETALRIQAYTTFTTLLDCGADPDYHITETALSMALRLPHLNHMVAVLISRGADTEAVNAFNQTYLMTCIANDRLSSAKMLLTHGISVDKQDKAGWSALHYAIEGDTIEAVQMLLDHQADANILDLEGRGPLHYAIVSTRPALVQLLLLHGANSSVEDTRGWNALDLTVHRYCSQLAYCRRYSSISRKDMQYRIILEALLAKNVNLDRVNRDGDTLLNISLRGCHYQLTRLLLDRGAKLEACHDVGNSLLEACRLGDLKMLRTLIDHKADLETLDLLGRTALHLLCQHEWKPRNVLLMAHLVRAGANVDTKAFDGRTPLMSLCTIDYYPWGGANYSTLVPKAVKMLLAAGANTALTDSFGKTALELLVERRYRATALIFLGYGGLDASGASLAYRSLCEDTPPLPNHEDDQRDCNDFHGLVLPPSPDLLLDDATVSLPPSPILLPDDAAANSPPSPVLPWKYAAASSPSSPALLSDDAATSFILDPPKITLVESQRPKSSSWFGYSRFGQMLSTFVDPKRSSPQADPGSAWHQI